jgi:hypothetical protein
VNSLPGPTYPLGTCVLWAHDILWANKNVLPLNSFKNQKKNGHSNNDYMINSAWVIFIFLAMHS